MKKIFFIVLAFAYIGCKEADNTEWLQSGTIQLTQPLVSSNSKIIDTVVTLKAELRINDVEIFYTNDGSEPTLESSKYIEPVEVNEAGVYKFKAFHNEWASSEVRTLELVKKGVNVDSINWHSEFTQSYPGKGPMTVIDHEKGRLDYRDNNWLGFNSEVMADVFFNDPANLKSANLGFLVGTGAWIFPPEEIEILISNDGKTFQSLSSHKLETPASNVDPELINISLPIDATVGVLRVIIKNTESIPEWHPAKGNAGWLFTDEWIFY